MRALLFTSIRAAHPGCSHISGLGGAVYSYLIVMSILFVLLLLEYIGCRADFARHPENDPTFVFPAAHGK